MSNTVLIVCCAVLLIAWAIPSHLQNWWDIIIMLLLQLVLLGLLFKGTKT